MTAPEQTLPGNVDDRTDATTHREDDASIKFQHELQAARMHEAKPTAALDSKTEMIDERGRYQVHSGESLWTIARASLENAGFDDINTKMIKYEMRRLVYLNKQEHPSLVHNPGSIKEGWELQVIAPEDVADRNERIAKYGTVRPSDSSRSKAVDAQGCPLDTEWKDAAAGEKTHVFSCEKVRAVANSTVIAHAGAEVNALRGSLVLALPGSKVRALYQSRVASYKANVDAWQGSEVMEVAPN